MVSYEKILAVLEEWKETVCYIHERKTFSLEPELDATTFKISVRIQISKVADRKIKYSEGSMVHTVTGLEKDYIGLDEKVFALKKFLNDFTCKFYEKVLTILADR